MLHELSGLRGRSTRREERHVLGVLALSFATGQRGFADAPRLCDEVAASGPYRQVTAATSSESGPVPIQLAFRTDTNGKNAVDDRTTRIG